MSLSAAINAVVVLALVALHAFLILRLIRVERALRNLLAALHAAAIEEVETGNVAFASSESLHAAIVDARRLVGL